jgi:predicted acyl esterase
MAAVEDPSRNDFFPPTSPEKSVRELGADAIRYRADYIMLPMRDGVRLATVVVRPRAQGRYPALMIRSPCGAAGTDSFVADPHNPVPSLGGDLGEARGG